MIFLSFLTFCSLIISNAAEGIIYKQENIKEIQINLKFTNGQVVLRRNSTLLKKNEGHVRYQLRPSDYWTDQYPSTQLRVKLEIDKEEPGKLYSGLKLFNPTHYPLTEIIGRSDERHEFFIADTDLGIEYDNDAPDFKITISETSPYQKACLCPYSPRYSYRDTSPYNVKYPLGRLVFTVPKTCKDLICSWDIDSDRIMDQDITFSSSSQLSSGDRLYIRSANGISEFKQTFRNIQNVTVPAKDSLKIFFIGSDNPIEDRIIDLSFPFENVHDKIQISPR